MAQTASRDASHGGRGDPGKWDRCPRSAVGLGRVKTFSCKRSELEEVATRAIFPDFDYALIAAISG
jgi:hypothetical protein